MSRLKPLTRETMSAAQSEVYNSIGAGARGGVRGPFTVLLHSPELARRVEQLGLFVRFQCGVPQRLRELAITIVAAHWQADYEWHAHATIARNSGVPAEILQAIGERRTPVFAEAADKAVYDYVRELLAEGRVGDAVYAPARQELGEQGIVDLTGLVGYYSLLALTLNAFEVAVPPDAQIPWRETGENAR